MSDIANSVSTRELREVVDQVVERAGDHAAQIPVLIGTLGTLKLTDEFELQFGMAFLKAKP